MKYILSICLAASAAFAASPEKDLRVIPYPRTVETMDARLALRGNVTISVASNDPEDRFAATLLAEEIQSATKIKAKIGGGSGGQIVLTRKDAPTELGEEGYTIDANAKAVRVTARTAAGIFYGVQTLR